MACRALKIDPQQAEHGLERHWKMSTEKQGGITTTAVEEIPRPVNQQEVEALAYEFWRARGCPDGAPEKDWFRAEETLKKRT